MKIPKLEDRLIDALFRQGLSTVDSLGGGWATWVNGLYMIRYRDLKPMAKMKEREIQSVTVDSLAALESDDKQRILNAQTVCFTWRQVLKAIRKRPG